MKSEINRLNYSSYRIPFLFEFVPGFEYDYCETTFIESYPFTIDQVVTSKTTNERCIIKNLYIYDNQQYADVEILYKDTSKVRYTPCILTKYLIPAYKTTQIWKHGIWGTGWGIQKKEYLIEKLKKKEVIISKMRNYSVAYIDTKGVYTNQIFTSREEMYKHLEEVKDKIVELKDAYKCIDLTDRYPKEIFKTSEELLKTLGNTKINLEAQPMKSETFELATTREQRKELHQRYINEKPRATESYLYAIHSLGKVYPFSDEKTKNYQKVVKRSGIPLSHISLIYRTTVVNGNNVTELVYKQKSKKKEDKHSKKSYSVHVASIKGEKRLICLQSTTDPNNLTREEKWIVDTMLDLTKWKIIDKNTYKRLTGKQVYVKNNDTGRIIGLRAAETYKLKGNWSYCTSKEHKEYLESTRIKPSIGSPFKKYTDTAASIKDIKIVNKLYRFVKAEVTREEYERKHRNKVYKPLNERLRKIRNEHTTSDPVKRRHLKNNASRLDVKVKYPKHPKKITEQEEQARLKHYEERKARYTERQANKKPKKTKVYNEAIREQYLEKQERIRKYKLKKRFEMLKQRYNYKKSIKDNETNKA